MTSRIRKWLRREPQPHFDPDLYARHRAEPTSIGIDDSTCEVTTSRDNPWKLPIPPPTDWQPPQPAESTPTPTPTPNPQRQSAFFNLPAEIRQQIYAELLGNNRVHVDFAFQRRSGWLDAPEKVRRQEYGRQWRWFHHVCPSSDGFHDAPWRDGCPPDTSEESQEKRYKLEGTAWLRTCRKGHDEALPALYNTTVFVLNHYAPDPVFRLSRVLPPHIRALITAVDVPFEIIERRNSGPEFNEQWDRVYPALFRTLGSAFPNLRGLRVTLSMEPLGCRTDRVDPDWFLGPWERLADSRKSWEMIDFMVPESWEAALRPRSEEHGGFTLSTTLDVRMDYRHNCGF